MGAGYVAEDSSVMAELHFESPTGLLPSSRCRECPLYSRLRYFVPKDKKSPPKAEIVIVLEAPGEREVAAGRPAVGPAGRELDRLLKDADIPRETVLVTNVLKCQPKDNKLPEDLPLAIACCSEILEDDIKDAKVVVGMGNVPLRALAHKFKITVRRGSVYPLDDGRPFVATVHPSFLVRAKHMKAASDKDVKMIKYEVIVADLRKAKIIAEGRTKEVFGTELFFEPQYHIWPNEELKQHFLKRAQDPEALCGVDIETTKARVQEAIPLIISFAFLDPDEVLTVDYDLDLEFIEAMLSSPCKKIPHNGVFDVGVNANVGLPFDNWWWDSMYLHHLIYGELSQKLGFVQSMHTVLPYHKDEAKGVELEETWEK